MYLQMETRPRGLTDAINETLEESNAMIAVLFKLWKDFYGLK